jgi:hypothetical protein
LKSLWTGVAGLMLGLSLISSGAAVASAQTNSMATLPPVGTTEQGIGTALDLGSLFHFVAPVAQSQSTDTACAADQPDAAGDQSDTDSVQDENGADDAVEGDTGTDNQAEDANEDPADTDNLQCGDQSGTDNAAP